MNERYMMVPCFNDKACDDKYYERFSTVQQATEVCTQILRQKIFWQDNNTDITMNNIKLYSDAGILVATISYDINTNNINVVECKNLL